MSQTRCQSFAALFRRVCAVLTIVAGLLAISPPAPALAYNAWSYGINWDRDPFYSIWNTGTGHQVFALKFYPAANSAMAAAASRGYTPAKVADAWASDAYDNMQSSNVTFFCTHGNSAEFLLYNGTPRTWTYNGHSYTSHISMISAGTPVSIYETAFTVSGGDPHNFEYVNHVRYIKNLSIPNMKLVTYQACNSACPAPDGSKSLLDSGSDYAGVVCSVGFKSEIIMTIWQANGSHQDVANDWAASYNSYLGGAWSVGNSMLKSAADIKATYSTSEGYDSATYRGNSGVVL